MGMCRLVAGVLVVLLVVGLGEGRKPANVLLIVLDDLGYNDLGSMGSPDVTTPNMDRLARGGVMFEEAYSMATFCSPARAGLVTGINPARYGHFFNPAHTLEDTKVGLPLHLTIIPQTLKAVGYRTSMVGKWHLGFTTRFHPLKRGFHNFYGFLGGFFNYFATDFVNQVYNLREYLYDQWMIADPIEYLTTAFTDKTKEYISKAHAKGDPFFIYLAYNAPHGPFQFLKADVDPQVSRSRQPLVAMIKALDDGVGALMDHLDDLGILEETLIILTNDNGGHRKGANNFPLSDFKGSWFEGGIRVPLFLYWKGVILPNQKIFFPITILDVYPTVQAAAMVPLAKQNPDLEGKNLLKYVKLKGRTNPTFSSPPHGHICLGSPLEGVVRSGRWKLHVLKDRLLLFDLRKDVGETKNLVRSQPGVVSWLLRLYERWRKDNRKTAAFDGDIVPTPLKLRLIGGRMTVKVREKVTFRATSRHLEGKETNFVWEFFKSTYEPMADFNLVRSNSARMRMNSDKSRATFTFLKPGRWTIRVNVRDNRFIKWKDRRVIVTR